MEAAMLRSSRARTASPGKDGQVRPALLGHLEDCWDEPVSVASEIVPGAPPLSDLERLQGAWVCVSERRQAEFLICGNRFTVHFTHGDIYMGTFELDGAVQPRTMIVRIEEGQRQHKGQTAFCIYEFDGEHLRWCTAGPGNSERLAGFPTDQDSQYLHLVFRRDRERPSE